MPKTIQIEAPEIGFPCRWWKIVAWSVNEDDFVTSGQTVAQLENDDVTCDLESFTSGRIQKLAAIGKKIEVGSTIAEICEDDEEAELYLRRKFSVSISLTGAELQKLDQYRGRLSREATLERIVVNSLDNINSEE